MRADEKQNHLRNHDIGLITFPSQCQMSHGHVTEISVITKSSNFERQLTPIN